MQLIKQRLASSDKLIQMHINKSKVLLKQPKRELMRSKQMRHKDSRMKRRHNKEENDIRVSNKKEAEKVRDSL